MNLEALFQECVSFFHNKQYEKAIKFAEQIYQTFPDNIDVNNILATSYFELGLYDNAEIYYKNSIRINPNILITNFNLGLILNAKLKFRESLKYFENAVKINPAEPGALNALATSYQNIGEYDKAILIYKQALSIKPGNDKIMYNLGRAMLAIGQFKEGWDYYDQSRIKLFPHHHLKLKNIPLWDGEEIQNKSIYVYDVAGLGDTIQYSRYIPLLIERGAKVYFQSQSSLTKLFKQSDFKCEFIENNCSLKDIAFDYQIPTMSLGRAFKTNFENIPFSKGYLNADEEKVNYYKKRFFNNDNFKIGIAWSTPNDKIRSIQNPHFLNELLAVPNVKLYSFQKAGESDYLNKLGKNTNIVPLGKTFSDFSDTLSAMKNLDLLITVDTSVLHLAGAAGISTWAIINAHHTWTWFPGFKDTCPWYKSVKLFRNKENEKIDAVIGDVLNSLVKIRC